MKQHWGKILGGIAGYVASRHPLGAAIGMGLGLLLDEGIARRGPELRGEGAFVAPLFTLAGAVAKSDGRVSPAEVAATEHWFGRMQLEGARREAAIRAFNAGKQAGFDIAGPARELERFCAFRGDLKLVVVELLVDIGSADGRMDPRTAQLLERIARFFGADESVVADLRARVHGASQDRPRPPPRAPAARPPHEVLGVPADASESEIRKAYRRLIAQHHPDKLVARGAPPAEIQAAELRAREINTAYEQLRLLAERRRR